MEINEETREHWDNISDEWYASQYENTDTLERIKTLPHRSFPTGVWENIFRFYPDLSGVKVCVPSSGNNVAAFSFHVLGAKVTSCDISSRQIVNAKRIADAQGWDIDFHVCDSMEMDEIKDDEFDLVFTSNGVHVWISALSVMYGNFYRILKDGGRYIFFETHPFIRPFDDAEDVLKVRKMYSDISNNNWRVQDFANSLIESGFTINHIDELSAEKDVAGAQWWNPEEWDAKADWQINPYAALPQWISFCTKK